MSDEQQFQHGMDMIYAFAGALNGAQDSVEEALGRIAASGPRALLDATRMWAEVLIDAGGFDTGAVLIAHHINPGDPRDPALFVARFVAACHAKDFEMAEALFMAPVIAGDDEQIMRNCRELLSAVGALRGAAL